jgi:hypothetical protein
MRCFTPSYHQRTNLRRQRQQQLSESLTQYVTLGQVIVTKSACADKNIPPQRQGLAYRLDG